ncbi:MAG: hypothetical protein D6706_03920 [Chloroflexi bacterium]|nr:MAG: hypothetical protein D6706_03920 [Chloroflexota bacterium]
MIEAPRLRALLRQAERIAESGKLSAAETLYRQILDEAPDAVEAWLGLARVSGDTAVQQEAYERVLTLDPANEDANLGLARLRGELPEVEEVAEAEPEEVIVAEAKTDLVFAGESEPLGGETAVTDTYEFACYRHPNRQTALRCYTCGKPICSRCAVKTPVGYRCPDCIREAEEVFYSATILDYILVALVTLPLSVLAGYLMLQFSGGFFFFLLVFFVGGIIGGAIGRIAFRVARRRRGRYLPHMVAGIVALGGVLPTLPLLLVGFLTGDGGFLFVALLPGIYAVIAASAAFYQVK